MLKEKRSIVQKAATLLKGNEITHSQGSRFLRGLPFLSHGLGSIRAQIEVGDLDCITQRKPSGRSNGGWLRWWIDFHVI